MNNTNNLEPKKNQVKKPDNTNKQLILVGVVTVILLIVAIFVHINRVNNAPKEEAEQKMTLEEALQKNKERDKKAQEEREAREKEKEKEQEPTEAEEDEHFKEENVEAKVEENTRTNKTDSSTYVNTYCDTNLTVASRYKKYVNYITISALDSNGCALENSKANATYIRDRSFRAYNLAMEHQKSFTNETVRKSGSIKADQITIQNTDGNIIGWAQILVYGDGASSGTYAYTKDGKWEFLG